MQPSAFLASPNFGIPHGTVGRAGQTIKAIVLHCISGLNEADGNSTLNQSNELFQQPHNSYHYAVGTEGIVHQYVFDTNVAWGFQSYAANAVPAASATLEGSTHPLIVANPGVQPDLYVLHVAIPCPSKNSAFRYDACGDPICTLPEAAQKSIYQLLHDLLEDYTLTTADLYLHSAIDTRYADETAACFDLAALKAAVDATTDLPADPTLACTVGQSIKDGVYVQGVGLDAAGCLVKGPAPSVIADSQVLSSADGSLTFTPSAPVPPDNQVNYDLSVNACAVVKKIVTANPAAGFVSFPAVDSTGACVPAAIPFDPAACPVVNAQVFVTKGQTLAKVQAHLAPVLAPANVSVGQIAYFKADGAVTVNDGVACDNGHTTVIKSTDPAITVDVTVNLIGAPATVITLNGAGAFTQGPSVTLLWIDAEVGYIII